MLEMLNEATRPHHLEADGDIERFLIAEPVTAHGYKTFLTRNYGFIVPLEAALASTPGLDSLVDLRARAKSHLIVRDLHALGMAADEIGHLPQCDSIPAFRGSASALGWMYVIERPLLASAVLKSHLASVLTTEMVVASAYLSCYAGHVGTAWRELGEAMDRIAETPAIADRIVGAARDAFRCLRRWRTIELAAAHRAVG
jgi:heme oxygenase